MYVSVPVGRQRVHIVDDFYRSRANTATNTIARRDFSRGRRGRISRSSRNCLYRLCLWLLLLVGDVINIVIVIVIGMWLFSVVVVVVVVVDIVDVWWRLFFLCRWDDELTTTVVVTTVKTVSDQNGV
jgi:hypothetical protein